MIYLSRLILKNENISIIRDSTPITNDIITYDDIKLISKLFNNNLNLNYDLQEHNYVVGFGSKMNADIFLVSVGNEKSCLSYSKEIVEFLVLSRAKGFIMVHNHPGRTEIIPSKEDYENFSMFNNISELLDIPFYDYIVVGDNKYYSAQENGDMEE